MINNRLVYLAIVALILSIAVFVFSLFWQKYNYQPLSLSVKILHSFETSSLLASAVPQIQSAIEPEIKSQSASLFFAGDIMLDRSVWLYTQKFQDYNYPFALFKIPEKFDWRIANLEGPITNYKSVAQVSRMTFTFSSLLLPALKNNFDIVSLANNHTTNFGQKGLSQTRAYLTTSSIQYFGDPNNLVNFMSATTSVNGVSIGLLGYNQLSDYDFSKILSEVRSLKSAFALSSGRGEVSFVIIYPHWGTEYQTLKPNSQQVAEAHQLLDAGADLIIGSHPHVIEPIEEYQGKYIFYSLGNFIFDQYFSLETQQGLTLGVYLTKTEQGIATKFKLFPVQISQTSQVSIAGRKVRDQILKSLAKLSQVNTSTRKGIEMGEF